MSATIAPCSKLERSNGDGCEVMLTVLRTPDMSDAKLEADARQVERDLSALKAVMEQQSR